MMCFERNTEMKNIIITDTTILEFAKSGRRVPFKNRVESARLLDGAGVDIIELCEFSSDKTEEILIKSVSAVVNNATIAVKVPLSSPEYAEKAAEALKNAAHKRLVVSAPVSAAQMEFFYHKKPAKMAEAIKNAVAVCKAVADDVEFVAEDALGGEYEVLSSFVNAAIEAGASTVSITEPTGTKLPDEIAALVCKLKAEIGQTTLCVSCSDAFGLGLSSALSAIKAGADGVKTSVGCESCTALEISEIARQRAEELGFTTSLNVTILGKTVNKISWMLDSDAPEVNVSAAVQSDTILKSGDGIEKLTEQIEKLGYSLSHEDIAAVYEEFSSISKKKEVGAKELEAIIATNALQVPPTYKLVSYVINSGNIISSMAHIKLLKDGRELDGICVGDGPIDAAFKALEQIIGHHYELDDFQIQSVTEGREAVGNALVKLRSEGKLYSGQGISTDIIGASIRAYVNALNKIVYGEE